MKVGIVTIPSAVICYELTIIVCLVGHQQIIIAFGSNINLESREFIIFTDYYGFVCIVFWQNLRIYMMRLKDNGIILIIIGICLQFNRATINAFWVFR